METRTFSTSWNRLCQTPPLGVVAFSAISARALRYSVMTCAIVTHIRSCSDRSKIHGYIRQNVCKCMLNGSTGEGMQHSVVSRAQMS